MRISKAKMEKKQAKCFPGYFYKKDSTNGFWKCQLSV